MNDNREAQRQQLLLGVINRSTGVAALAGWAGDSPLTRRGLQVYQANAGALAERALVAAYPVTQQLLGATSFAHLARALWRQQPPTQGDVATWGAGLARFLADAERSVNAPHLPDVARLEWAVHLAASAADAPDAPGAFDRLADTDPAALWLLPRPGTALLQSLHPLASIWHAHQKDVAASAYRLADQGAALARGEAESALVWRQGWHVRVVALDKSDAAFTGALLQGQTLGAALGGLSDGSGFDFETWLVASLKRGWLLGFLCRESAVKAP